MSSHCVSGSPECGDFLRTIANPPNAIEFVSCESKPKSQSAPLKAIYRVEGEIAHDVEQYLHRELGVQGG
ncbi:DUF4952 domain-containing protein [Pseudomonas sp. LD120]|uniref:DUF4952 domain-containing protein n=1 Tax=Pseudomonas sp. LD120 TaxID=485751 RepID=UPI0035321ABF